MGIDIAYSKYAGSNSYGVSRIIDKESGEVLYVAIPASTPLLDYMPKDSIPVSLEKARSLKAQKGDIAALFIGYIMDANILYEEDSLDQKPAIDDPRDISLTDKAIPFELDRIIYYVVRTGEIIGQRTLSQNNSEDSKGTGSRETTEQGDAQAQYKLEHSDDFPKIPEQAEEIKGSSE